MTVIYLSKQRALDADPKARQQINFTGNLIRENNQGQNLNDNATMFFIIEEAKEATLYFSQELLKYCDFLLLYCNIGIK